MVVVYRKPLVVGGVVLLLLSSLFISHDIESPDWRQFKGPVEGGEQVNI